MSRKTLLPAAALMIVFLAVPPPGPAYADGEPIVIQTQGRAVMRARPETAQVQIGFVARSGDIKTARAESQAQAAVLITVAASVGIPAGDVISRTRTTVEIDPAKDGASPVYLVSRTAIVIVRVPEHLQDFIDALLEYKTGAIEDVTHTLADPGAQRSQALAAALDDALAEARRIAKQAGLDFRVQYPVKEQVTVRFIGPQPLTFGSPTPASLYEARRTGLLEFSTAAPQPTREPRAASAPARIESYLSSDGENNLGVWLVEATVDVKAVLK